MMAESKGESTGGCLCGALRYRINRPLDKLIQCHCTHCQKTSGAGASFNAAIPADSFELTRGTPKRYDDKADSGNILWRFFCGDCGSPLYSQRSTLPGFMVIKAGSLDDSDQLKVTMNIWTRSARPWMPIDPALEQHPQNRPVK
jgi:hypothetical protein